VMTDIIKGLLIVVSQEEIINIMISIEEEMVEIIDHRVRAKGSHRHHRLLKHHNILMLPVKLQE